MALPSKRQRKLPLKLQSPSHHSNDQVKEYCVVEFLLEKSVCTVPISWMTPVEESRCCYWPLHYTEGEVRKAIKNGDDPDLDTWEIYLVKLYHKGRYEQCELFANELVKRRSSESEAEPLVHKLKKKKRKDEPEIDKMAETERTVQDTAAGTSGLRSETPTEVTVNEPQEVPIVVQCRNCARAVNCQTCMETARANKKFQKKLFRTLLKMRSDIIGNAQAQNLCVKQLRHEDIEIPLTSMDDLISLEGSITPQFINDLKEVFKTKVDVRLYYTALAMLKSVFTLEFMEELNWEGKNKDKAGLVKKAPKLAAVILDAAKEAVGSKWPMKDVKEKLMRIFVKAKELAARQPTPAVPAGNSAANDVRDTETPP